MDFRSLFAGANDFTEDPFLMEDQCGDDLPDIGSLFSVPPLADKPQNPIMDSLEILPSPRTRTDAFPEEPSVYMVPLFDHPSDVWNNASLLKHRPKNQALFWDRIRPNISPDRPSSTPFISEQDNMVYSIARHQLQADNKLDSDRIYVNQFEFLSALRTTVLGISSIYHIWDMQQERFVYLRAAEGRQGCFIVDGKDDLLCQSITQRFLTIGTLIRRLETLLVTLRARSAHEGSTIHAFAHSISTILACLREDISRCSTNTDQHLSAICMQYAIYEDILVALSSFYGRSENVPPKEYPPLKSAPIPLLNQIYNELMLHMERQSPRIITATLAFILTNTCQDYLRETSHTVGYGKTYVRKSTHVVGERPDQYATDDVEEEEQANDIFEAMEKLSTEFPSFFPSELIEVLPAAQKSLILLQEAQPEHTLLVSPENHEAIHWFWTEHEIEGAWNRTSGMQEEPDLEPQPLSSIDQSSSTLYKPELAQFRIFDQDPGSHIGQSALKSENSAVATFRAFVDRFPERLPPITPTLAHLASLVFSKLVDHASKLSDALLLVFLSPDNNLNLRAHLGVLRSFLLVTSPAFESRLSAALFSDAEEYGLDTKQNGMSLHSLRRRPSRKVIAGAQPWAVGLAAALLDRETWPPVGTDLGFFLRTVIVDSIGSGSFDERDKVLEEAEYRLGFAIRDLPVGSGKKWMNPLSIEWVVDRISNKEADLTVLNRALDFLYMDYKPPRALEVLVTPEILSKYQRMFAFILRLMRVTHAVKGVYRMSRSSYKPLFQTLVKFRKLLFHFRFVAQSFVSNLSAYVFDMAIGGNFDPFIERLVATAAAASSISGSGSLPTAPVTERFSDVFSLSQNHSELLDNILSACLLRSGQREVGDILRQALELVLEFSVVIGELHRGRLEEYQAGPVMESIYVKFRGKMMMFTRVLKELAEKMGGNASISVSEDRNDGCRRAVGGMAALSHLMVKLDMVDWWTSNVA